jgi:hypothetical protein
VIYTLTALILLGCLAVFGYAIVLIVMFLVNGPRADSEMLKETYVDL